jgi:hypothetical protein
MNHVYDFCQEQIFKYSFLSSLVSNFLTSFAFIFLLLWLFRPNIKISPVVAHHIDQLDPNNRPCWVFKIFNRSHFSAFDIKIEILQSIPIPTTTGHYNYRQMPIQLVKSEFYHVAPYKYKWQDKNNTEYALQFRTYEDLQSILNANGSSTIHLRVICRHSLTGLGKVWNVKYTNADIKSGKFKPGNDFGIV